jgi:hypothetical protein
MKFVKTLLVSLALIGAASATTISVGGGTSGALWVTSTGVTLTAANSVFKIGLWNGTTFTQFASTDTTPMAIGTAVFAGKLTGNYSDNSAAATTFNNALIWYQVAVNLGGGATGLGYFSGPDVGIAFPAVSTKFPANGAGVGDSLAAETRNLTVLGAGSTDGSRGYSSAAAGSFPANSIVVGVIPEPSAALLGAFGALGLLRRRRI